MSKRRDTMEIVQLRKLLSRLATAEKMYRDSVDFHGPHHSRTANALAHLNSMGREARTFLNATSEEEI